MAVFLGRLAMVMMGLALAESFLAGIVSRSLLKTVSFDYRQLVSFQLFLSHGHIFILGVVIPIILAFFVRSLRADLTDGEVRSLKRGVGIYIAGSLLTLGLMLYKGYAYVLLFSAEPIFPLETIDSQLFGGNQLFRSLAYGLAHPLLALGLIWCLVVIYRAGKR